MVVLDVDGVLVDVEPSFREAVRVTVGRAQRELGIRDPWIPTMADVRALKRTAGFNDDVDVAMALTALAVAGRRFDLDGVARDLDIAGGGLQGLRAVAPDLPQVSGALVARIFDEHYWGSAGFRDRFGDEPVYGPSRDGLRALERVLVAADLCARLREQGVLHLAVVSGRTPFELDAALERLGWARSDFAAMVTSDVVRKPDPRCLDAVVEATGASRLVYVGDARDDWDLIRRFRAERDGAVASMAVIVGPDAGAMRDLGCDATLAGASALPALLAHLAAVEPAR